MSVAGFRTGRGSAAAASALLLALVCASPAWSQAAPAGKRWVVDLSASATYDSNTARGSDALAAVRGLRQGEFTYSPNANLDITQPFLGQLLFLNGDVGYVFHQYNKQLRSQRIGLTGGLQTGYGPCSLQLVGGLSSRQSDLAELSITTIENKQTTTSGSASVSCNPLHGVGVTGGYSYAQTRNSSDTGTQDSHSESVNLGVTYSNRLLGTASASGSYSRTGYDNLIPNDPFAPRDFQSYTASVSIARPIGTRLTGQATIGYTTQDSDGGGPGFSGITGSGSLTYRVNPRMVASVNYLRSSTGSVQQGASFIVSQNVGMRVNYRLGPRLSATLGGTGARRSYRGQTIILPTSLLSDETYGVSSSLALSVGRSSSVGVNASYEHRSANPSIYDYNAYRAGVSVSTTF